MLLRLRPLLPLLLLLLPAAANAATRPPSNGQLRAVVGRLLPPAALLTDVSSEGEWSQGTRTVVVEFRPEDRGGAAAISRVSYDPARPRPLNGLLLRVTRSSIGRLDYSMIAVSEAQDRFWMRGYLYQGQRTNEQILSMTWEPLTADAPQVEAWFDALQFSDNAYRLPAGSFLLPASSNAAKTSLALMAVYKIYRYCSRVPFLGDRCLAMLDRKATGVINLSFPAPEATQINGALHSCSALALRRAWRRATGYNAPVVLTRIHVALARRGCS